MKNIFGFLGFKPKKPKTSMGRPEIRLPFSDGKSKKTMAGLQPEKPAPNRPTQGPLGGILNCPECRYPLRVEPSKSSPCPNCGYSGSKPENTVFNAGKTMAVSGLEEIEIQGLNELRFKLIDESNKSELKIQSDDPEVMLNRDYLDPGNMSISGEQHVIFKLKNRQTLIRDVSSNGSTFIQVKAPTPLVSGTRIVLGNKICLFTVRNKDQKAASENATKKMGGIDFKQQGSDNSFELKDDKSGRTMSFSESHVVVNRVNLDTGNNTISGSRHAEFTYENGTWLIHDLSSTGATFVQLTAEKPLEDNTKIIIGNKVYTFMYD